MRTLSILRVFRWLLLLCLSCRYFVSEPAAIVQQLAEHNSRPLPPDTAEVCLKFLERRLEPFMEEGEIHREWLPTLSLAISRYQFYFFLKPDKTRFERLHRYYAFGDRWQCRDTRYDFEKIREIVARVDSLSRQARDRWERLLRMWADHPDRCAEFMEKLADVGEVGGVILYSPERGVSWHFIEDRKRMECMKYLEEFRQNDFANVGSLEDIFVRRLLLEKARGDSTDRTYVATILPAARRHFECLRRLRNSPRPFSAEVLSAIETSKKALLSWGLESLLLKHSYFLDRRAYLFHPEIAFFFHSHPYRGRPYPKPPSGHDEEMTLRSGPSLVFDVQRHGTVVYLVVLGETIEVYRCDGFAKTLKKFSFLNRNHGYTQIDTDRLNFSLIRVCLCVSVVFCCHRVF